MQYLPIFTKLDNKPVLVVGGGEVALRKCRAFLKARADVTLVAPWFCDELKEHAQNNDVTLIDAFFDESHLDGKMLVIAATDNDGVNNSVFELANARNVFVNVVDDQPKCTFIFPSIVDRDPITIAISSAGTAPVLARRLREKLETLIPQHIGPLASLVGSFRDKVKQRFTSFADRRQFWEGVFDSSVVSKVQTGDTAAASVQLEQLLDSKLDPEGEVYVIGAGPGDPELLTLKALQLMQQADVVVYDFLVSDEIMELVRRDADLICVGKRLGDHSVVQEDTNQMLVDLAKQGKKVCRIKGGDPFIYGRGGEEVQVLAANNVNYQIVPGITAAAGCSAYAGIPLTHRDHAQAIQFVTGHCKKDGQELDWQSLAKPNQTLAIYMGVIKSPHIQAQLLKHGRGADTPVAIIENGTRKNQRVVTGKLGELADLIERHSIISPALLIIGEVASLHEELHWFGTKAQTSSFAQPLTDVA
ncbi:uroporphyrinogen-III C-methyltransferase [Pseudoalteromonas sp. SG43-7]|jgi:uroporphyrin-III C-methyltransferase/precorrin-2 dehydrogenase/sirohydrochlorin ferrochelatase|uniref:siroheme synthase CysG n=1 Tax=unclassified Pseudoalteromonas TaxID=194690 RepID=UPI0015FF4769|nr:MULTISPECIES: siroheme synthase CysG [unclassified Pseudoalteromonas]MBB1302579.1 uroporphyrinogen-III C-methyltransferase [Pseudoalteromonas sp. SR44-8]MBB1310716.1 uroporphyrinogen-III C-methyltransferase [Pseudoalteromonas sp. SR41-8]MBB1344032.1 uroporphyrinogen-III C-methyltransferase [Pseudoalteromonas sp. SR45-6]MBB1399089.1 uroporphyrinogen-III C-methyltransferase [Pseudoalteromonas sp. SG44-8]MBB1423723.1 uroporphyrinogen-III C-methyltransferase [Pseudoalteromonas sp. SG43-7]